MSSDVEVMNIDDLLKPISEDNPVGANLQYKGLFDKINEARRADDNLEQGEWKRDIKLADWSQVVALASEAMATQTKDLRVAAWLAEGLIQLHGFAGLRDSLRLTSGLLERFWDTIYPEMEEGDLDARANALSAMSGKLAFVSKMLPLTKTMTGVNYSFLQWEEAATRFDVPERLEGLDSEELRRINGRKEQAAAEGKITSEQWRSAKNATRRAFYEELYTLLNECWGAFQTLDQIVNAKFGRQAPSLSALSKSLDSIRSLVEKVVKEKYIKEPGPDDAPVPEVAVPSDVISKDRSPGVPAAALAITGPVRTRQEALRRLEEVAEYFRTTEPHSPVSYLVQRAIRWGQMPLEAWLAEVVKNDSVLDSLRETLGLKMAPDGNSSGKPS